MRFDRIIQLILLISLFANVPSLSYTQIMPSLTIENDSGVAGLVFSNAGSKLIAGGKSIHIWDMSTGEKIKTFNVEGDPFYSASSIALSPSEKYLVVGGPLPYVTIWDINTEKIVARVTPEDFPYIFWNATNITAVAFTNDEGNIVIGDLVGNVSLWDWKNNHITELFQNIGAVKWLYAFPSTNRFMAQKLVYSIDENKIIKNFNYIVYPSSNGSSIYSYQGNEFVSYDSSSFKIQERYPLVMGNHQILVSHIGDLAITMPKKDSEDQSTIYDVKSNKAITKCNIWDSKIKDLRNLKISKAAFSQDGKWLAAVEDNFIYIFDTTNLTSSVKEAEALER